MAKTLADMTAEERADCVGMWAEHAHPHYDGLEVIIDSDHDSVTTISTKSGQQYIVVGEVMRHIAPRFDLPRAWTPDGQPVKIPTQALAEETWEYTQEIYFNGKWQPIYEDLWYDNPEECESLFLDIEPWKYHDEPLRIVRRRVSPPEVINE